MVGYCLTGVDAASTRCSSCTARARTASRCSSTRWPPSWATTRPTRRWTPSWKRAPTGTRPIWRACAARASWRPSKPSRAALERVQGQGHHRWRQDLRALHAPGLLRVLPAVQVVDRGQPQARHPQHRRGDEAAAAPDPVHDHRAARAPRQAPDSRSCWPNATASWRGPCRAAWTGSAWVGSSPRSVVAATEEYFEAEDALGRWLDERCVRDTQRQVADRRTVHRLEAVGRSRGRVHRLASASPIC
jgi:hypothetical protein